MIRFCDKEVFIVEEGQMSRGQMLSFFLKDHIFDVIMLVNPNQDYLGVITYQRLLKHDSIEQSLLDRYFLAGEGFWEEARRYFEEKPEDLVPVFDMECRMLGFCYDDDKGMYYHVDEQITALENSEGNALFLQDLYPRIKQVCIFDCNEFAFRIYCLCERYHLPVCVIGEKWEWFGIKTCEGFTDYPEYEKFYIYAEGNENIRAEKEYGICRYGNVVHAFKFMGDITNKNIIVRKKQVLEKLTELQIPFCNIIIPDYEDISNICRIEAKGAELKCNLDLYVRYPDTFQGQRKDILFDIYGKELCEELRTEKMACVNNDKKIISFGQTLTYYMSKQLENKRIYLIGPCIIEGFGTAGEDCLVNQIQKMVEQSGYSVLGVTMPAENIKRWEHLLNDLPVRKSDMIVFIDEKKRNDTNRAGVQDINALEIYEEKRAPWFGDSAPIHLNKEGAAAMAKFIFRRFISERLVKSEEKVEFNNPYLLKGEILCVKALNEVKNYIASVKDIRIGGGINHLAQLL